MKKANTKKAVAYIRMSSDGQEKSPEQQRAEIQKQAAQHGYTVTHEYIDAGISGDKTHKRKQFLKMHADALAGEFDTILCWDQDRFGRFDSIEAGYWIHPLREAGVQLLTVTRGLIDWNSFEGRIVNGVTQEGKNLFLRNLSENVLRGQSSGASQGASMGGRANYGYRWKREQRRGRNGDIRLVCTELEIDPVEAPVVEWFFAEFGNGQRSIRGMCRELNDKGNRTRKGTKWIHQTVLAILKNPRYTGDSVWNRSSQGQYHNHRAGKIEPCSTRRKRHNDREDWIVAEDAHTAIVSRELFDRVQERLEERSSTSAKMRDMPPTPLNRKLVCGHCNKPMRRKGPHFVCQTYSESLGQKCNNNSVRTAVMLDGIATKIRERFLSSENLDSLRASLERQLTPAEPDTAKADTLRAEIRDIDRQIEQAGERLVLVPVDMMHIIQTQIEKLQRRREQAQQQLQDADAPAEQPDNAAQLVDRAMDALWQLAAVFQDADEITTAQVIDEIVDRVEIVFRHDKKKIRTKSHFERAIIHIRRKDRMASTSWASHRGRYRPPPQSARR